MLTFSYFKTKNSHTLNAITFLSDWLIIDLLDPDELNAWLEKYENEVYMQSIMYKEQKRRGHTGLARSKRETYLWDMIMDNSGKIPSLY